MRKVCIVLTGIFLPLLFTTCKQFTADIEDYLSYWAAEVSALNYNIDKPQQTNKDGILCVASAADVTVTVKLNNPKNFRLVMPASSADAGRVIRFPNLSAQPEYGADYTLVQPAHDTLTLTYKKAFLQAHEWGNSGISPEITLTADDGRVFKQTFTVSLKANTPPPKPGFIVAKTAGSSAYYVLCLTAPDMDKKIAGGLLHKDLARIEVNGTGYSFSVNEAQKAFTKPESDSFITHSDVTKLSEPDADEVPTGGWVLYYKTDVEVKEGAAKKDYTVRLADAQGLVSELLNASTKPNKAENETIRITKGTKISGSGSESDPTIIGTGSAGAELTASSPTENTTVHCTVSEIGGAALAKYDGNPVTVPLPLNGAGEKKYKLEYYTDGEGFTATPVRTVYYKVVQGHTVSFDANGGRYPDGTTVVSKSVSHGNTISAPDVLPKKQGFGVTGWYKDKACSAGQAWNFAADTVTSDITLYAKWIAGSGTPYKVEHYQQNIADDNYPSTATETENLTGAAGQNAAVTQKNYKGFEFDRQDPSPATIAADGSTVVKVYYKRKIISVTFDPAGGKIEGNAGPKTLTGKYGAPLTAPAAEWTGHTFIDWNPSLPADSTFPAENAEYTAQWNVNFYTVTFSVDGGTTTGGTLKAKPEGGTGSTTTTTGTVSVEHGKKVDFTAKPADGWEVGEWSNTVTVTPSTGNKKATLSNVTADTTVTVKFYQPEIDGTASMSWKALLSAVRNAPANATITINGAINATIASGNNGEIVINKNLTIKGSNKSTDILNAITLSRIFKVKTGNTLTLENITLKNGKAPDDPEAGDSKDGGGIYSEGTLTLKNTTITSCGAKNGGGIYAQGSVEITLTNTEINGCVAEENGGAVYVYGAKFTMKDSAKVDTNNDVHLSTNAKIIVAESLTGTAPVARITVPDTKYQVGTQVLTGSKVSSNHLKFSVTRGGSPVKDWYVDKNGKLTDSITDIFNNITRDAIQAVESSMTSNGTSTPKEKLEGKLLLYKTSEGNYGIMHVTEVNTGPTGYIKFNYKTFKSGGAVQSGNDITLSKTWVFNLDDGTDDGAYDFQFTEHGYFWPYNGAKFYILGN